jgi:hypothetical protein
MGVHRYKSLMSIVIDLAPGVETTLLNCTSAVAMLAVLGADLAGVGDAIAPHGEADSALLFFLRSFGQAEAQVRCLAALEDVADLDEPYDVGTLGRGDAARGKPLRQTGDLFGAAAFLERAVGALEQSLVLGELAGVNVQGGVGGVGDVVA